MRIKKALHWAAFTVLVIALAGCAALQKKDLSYGIGQINKLNAKYGVTMASSPDTMEKIGSFVDELNELKKNKIESGQEPFDALIEFRIHNLEADRYFMENKLKYGERGTTINGFGCKGRHRILNSSGIRIMSASEGFKAVERAYELIEKYPEESKIAGLSMKDALFLNATFYEIDRQAKRDQRLIENFCPEETYQEIIRQEELKKKLMGAELDG